MRSLYLLLGWFFVGLGVVGIVLPVLPTTPFILVAAGFFAKGSPRAERWLMEHPVFGEPLAAWRERGAIPTYAKVLAVSMMSLSFGAILLGGVMPLWATIILGGLLLACAFYVMSRPAA
ncbi:MAG: hypothetical protein RLZZ444_2372 [Pseudomonadota bacterium]|jgi:uncharacterized membrane protein YbaN (DUF454 family)